MMARTLLALLLWASAAQAEDAAAAVDGYLAEGDRDWSYRLALYGWAAGVDGTTTVRGVTADVDASFDELLENLEGALQFRFEAAAGRFGIFVDFIYMRLKPDGRDLLGVVPIATEGEAFFVNLGARYRVLETGRSFVDLGAGARVTALDIGLAPANAGIVSRNQSWVDGFLNARGSLGLSRKWNLDVWLMAATGGSDFTWQAFVGAGYRLSERFVLGFGYRWLDIDYSDGGFALDAMFSGPIIGLVMAF